MLLFLLEMRQITILDGTELIGHVSMSSMKAPLVVGMSAFLPLFHCFTVDISFYFPLLINALVK